MELVYVWYNDIHFIPDTLDYPFMSNVKYNSRSRKCHVFYYVVDNVEVPINESSLTFYNFSVEFPEYMNILVGLSNVAQKIDFMKIVVLCNFYNVTETENDLLLLDFDCHITSIKEKIYNLEAFYCSNVKYLITEYMMEKTSYIENYATRIDREGSKRFADIYRDTGLNCNKDNKYSYVYMVYVNMVIRYFHEYENYNFPPSYKNLTLQRTLDISYSRGSTWKNSDIYDQNEKASWIVKNCRPFNESIKQKLGRSVLFDNFGLFRDTLLKELNLPLNLDLFWLNEKQRRGTIKEYILEKVKPKNVFMYLIIIENIAKYQALCVE
ncbi:ORF-139 [Teiidae poxvirus 1]|nr:ORF-139 [Teiidae poxvirus 1]